MAQGRIKRIANTERKFGADEHYLFLKVQAEGRGEAGEEYWLVTEEEAAYFEHRASNNPEDRPKEGIGVFSRVANNAPTPTANEWYIALKVQAPSGNKTTWMLTEHDLERIRQRVEKNTEDIEANREGWLADLFD
jgi:hypothetical protein